MSFFVAGAMIVGTVVTASVSASEGRKNRELADSQAQDALAFQKQQQAKLDAQKEIYKQMNFENPYKNVKNVFEGARNVFEDLTINQRQAQFESQQGAQQRANIMDSLKQAAGSTGIAALAQAMANQGALQTQAISAGIGQQESRLQQLRATGEQQRQQQVMAGESAALMARLGGEARLQQMEMDRQATLLGMAQGESAGANAALQQAYAGQMSAQLASSKANVEAWSNVAQSGITAAGTIKAAKIEKESDRRLKKNINKIGESPSGLNIYSFEYIDSKYGEGLFQGVMSDEIPQEAVVNVNGYDKVNYNMLDVEFKQI